ncbi:CBS domain-containing protein, partial [Escherichia coli]|uniref:CBS domain-containing protein n=1 Tax=Escherichia coli TaxID=562 RepID=UPI0005C4A474
MTIARILAEKGGDIVTITPERTLDEAIHLLAEKRIGALVVTHGDGSVAVGD